MLEKDTGRRLLVKKGNGMAARRPTLEGECNVECHHYHKAKAGEYRGQSSIATGNQAEKRLKSMIIYKTWNLIGLGADCYRLKIAEENQ